MILGAITPCIHDSKMWHAEVIPRFEPLTKFHKNHSRDSPSMDKFIDKIHNFDSFSHPHPCTNKVEMWQGESNPCPHPSCQISPLLMHGFDVWPQTAHIWNFAYRFAPSRKVLIPETVLKNLVHRLIASTSHIRQMIPKGGVVLVTWPVFSKQKLTSFRYLLLFVHVLTWHRR